MRDNETQKELLKETVEPTKALEVTIQMEMGTQNQQKLNQKLALTTNSVNVVNTFSNEPIKAFEHLETTVTYNNWTCKDARLTIVEDGHKIIIGRDLFNSLGLAIVQQQQPEDDKCVDNINNSTCRTKDTIEAQFPHLVSRFGLSKTDVAKSKYHQKFTAKHQKVDAFPLIHNLGLRRNGNVYRMKAISKNYLVARSNISYLPSWSQLRKINLSN